MTFLNTDNLKQFVLIGLIIVLGYALGRELYIFFPGVLGAITLYILMRQKFFELTVIKNWKKWLTALLFILVAIVIFVLPIAALVQVLLPKFTAFLGDESQLNTILETLSRKLQKLSPHLAINDDQVRGMIQRATTSVPTVLNATLNMLTNAILAFFLLYYMLVDGRKMEYTVQKYIPLKDTNIDDIWEATRIMVVSNAIGIPVLAASQAIVSILGYYMFGIEEYILWGVITGVFSLVPIIGTAVVWIPLCVYLYAIDRSGQGTGLLFYSLLITGSVDNILRFTILRRLGDIHPITTALGIMVGIPLFGFMGFIFGPMLISYFLLLIKIFRVEFSPRGSATD
ncbi:AI-2E family transporter [Polluticoccus soli]|uniref:AI-2E family transporter n=1 Tax=Polluticoccus soli TaxID=3034150 RepID=UPI0023E0AEE8|nr:AI-2E family transporter [Flavipsychrobacter sp. JY13-12]